MEKLSFTYLNAYFKSLSQINEIASLHPSLNEILCTPGLSNLGLILKPLSKFGENIVTDAYVIPPAVRAPGLLLLACTYNGILSLVISFYKDELSSEEAKKLLDKISMKLYGML